MSAVKVKEWDTPGHFIGADQCRFFKHTHVGKWCISTVGEYYRSGETKPENIGSDKYETMVFNTRLRKERWSEVDGGDFPDRASAIKGHAALVRKYKRKESRPS